MPARKSSDSSDSAAENTPPPAKPVPMVTRADVAGVTPGAQGARGASGRTEPPSFEQLTEKTPLADDQVEVTLPDGTHAVVDRVMADALKEAEGRKTPSVKQYPPGYEPEPTKPGVPPAEAPATSREGANASDAGQH